MPHQTAKSNLQAVESHEKALFGEKLSYAVTPFSKNKPEKLLAN
jgi:hypothetical protein